MRATTHIVGWALFVLVVTPISLGAQGSSGLVKLTPFGSHDGELCSADRAIVFEDPTGIRILYDPGNTVDETDARLGTIHAMLLSHVHGDHIGTNRPNRAGGTCAAPGAGAANADSNFATIAAAKGAVVLVSTDMVAFLGRKIQNVRGSAVPGCPTSGHENETIVPAPSTCTAGLNPGSSRMLTRSGAGSVRIAVVPALHTNGIPATLLEPPALPPGVVATAGPPTGFVIAFSNGLRAYLSGDTGVTSEMDTVGRMYRPNLAVINVSDIFTTGPSEAAFAIQNMIRPASVMPSHVNEQATAEGRARAGTRVDRFTSLVQSTTAVVLTLSGVTRSFDGEGRCIGCR